MRKNLLPVFLFVLAIGLTACGGGKSTSGSTGGDDVAAEVNGVSIPVKDVDRVITQQ
ncbi:MAG: hypothetical protein IPO77_15255 [Acidobacteria bacterium]|nr:hypothetical protein [Acidobacteriota bacterium]